MIYSVVRRKNLYLYSHFGSQDVDLICQRIVYMAKAFSLDLVVLDHLSILISQTAIGTDERKLIDYAMTKMRSLVQEHDIGLILVSHLRRPDGNRGHEVRPSGPVVGPTLITQHCASYLMLALASKLMLMTQMVISGI